MIKQILKDLVESYQESEFVNYGRDISYFAARRKLLISGKVYFYEVGTTYPKPVSDNEWHYVLPNPIIADCEGRFPSVVGEGKYKIQVEGQGGEFLLCIDCMEA
jgi:hypothetical protein